MRVGGGQAADAMAAVVAGAGVGGVGDAGGGAVVCGRASGGGWGEGVLALRGSGPNVQWERGRRRRPASRAVACSASADEPPRKSPGGRVTRRASARTERLRPRACPSADAVL